MPRELYQFKSIIDQKFAETVYFGLWYSPLREALQAFVTKSQETVTGTVRLKLHKGNCTAVGRESEFSLYDYALATYDKADAFNHTAALGFIYIWGLPTKVAAFARQRQKKAMAATATATQTTNATASMTVAPAKVAVAK